MEDIKLSEDPQGWVTYYLKERARMALDGDYTVGPPLDPQFDLYAAPIVHSYIEDETNRKARHVLILPILPEEDFGSVEKQIREVYNRIKPSFKEDYFIYTYDTVTSEGKMLLTSDYDFLTRLLEDAITEDVESEGDAPDDD